MKLTNAQRLKQLIGHVEQGLPVEADHEMLMGITVLRKLDKKEVVLLSLQRAKEILEDLQQLDRMRSAAMLMSDVNYTARGVDVSPGPSWQSPPMIYEEKPPDDRPFVGGVGVI